MKRSINFKKLGFRAKIPQIWIGMISKGKMHKMVLYPQMHDPSSQPSQLNAKYARKYQDSNLNLKVAKTWKIWEKSSYLDLILRIRW
jgi:hypothetical protein